jgi:hypothetical protein
MHWWASHGAAGVNFHTGDNVAAGSTLLPAKYAVFVTAPGGYSIRPLSYGLLAFSLGGKGRNVPATASPANTTDLSAYGVQDDDGTLYVTLINKSHGAVARVFEAAVTADQPYAGGQIMFLTAPNNDIATTASITLGGESISSDGHWTGTWKPLPAPEQGSFKVELPAATAAVIKLTQSSR